MTEWKEEKLGNVAQLQKKSWQVGDRDLPYIALEHIVEGGLRLQVIGNSKILVSNKYHFDSNCLAVMHKCMTDFRRIVREFQCGENINKKVLRYDLLGLFNEQLFYMKMWYLPRSIRKEWEKTMLHYLRNEDNCVVFEDEEWRAFDRVRKFMGKSGKG